MDDYHTIITAKNLASQLRDAFPDDLEALADTVEGETDVSNALYRILLSAEENRMFATAIKSRIEDLRVRMERFVTAEERKRAIVQSAMEQCNIRKIDRPEFSARLGPSPPKVIITEETALPEEYLRTTVEPNKSKIGAMLKTGATIPGAVLSNPSMHLTIKRS